MYRIVTCGCDCVSGMINVEGEALALHERIGDARIPGLEKEEAS